MAQAMAAAAVHSMPPFPLPAVPRVRPPPIPKGTPGPNTLPVPKGRVPRGKVWADGKYVPYKYPAAKHLQKVQSRQLEKALKHEVLGMNIYAYRHVRTDQVVYSLTRHMENSKMMKQLLFHGKKTRPAALRRDLWRPYFSIHFPNTPAGAHKGLRVYHELRELTLRRQLSPPKPLAFIAKRHIYIKSTNLRNQRQRQWKLAKRLMNQKGSAVADVSAVLRRMSALTRRVLNRKSREFVEVPQTLEQRWAAVEKARETRMKFLGASAYGRLRRIRAAEEEKQRELELRKVLARGMPGGRRVDKHTIARIATEYDGAIDPEATYKIKLDMINRAKTEAMEDARTQLRALPARMEKKMNKARKSAVVAQMSAVRRSLAALPESKQLELQEEFDAERTKKLAEAEKLVEEAKQALAVDISALQQDIQSAETTAKKAALARRGRALKRDRSHEIMRMKADLFERAGWVGSYAAVATSVDSEMAEIERIYKSRKEKLQAIAKEQSINSNSHEVVIRWADLRDGVYAPSWPDNVLHESLQPKVVLQSELEKQRYAMSSSVHVFGGGLPKAEHNVVTAPAQKDMENRSRRIAHLAEVETARLRDHIAMLTNESVHLRDQFESYPDDVKAQIRDFTSQIDTNLDIARNASETYVKTPSGEQRRLFYEFVTYVRVDLLNWARGLADLLQSKEARRLSDIYLQWTEVELQIYELSANYPDARNTASERVKFVKLFTDRQRLQKLEDHEGIAEIDVKYPFVVKAIKRAGKNTDPMKDEQAWSAWQLMEAGSSSIIGKEVGGLQESDNVDQQEEAVTIQHGKESGKSFWARLTGIFRR